MLSKKLITELSYEIVGAAIEVHRQLGPGLLESVYEQCLKYELEERGFIIKQQVLVPVYYNDLELDTSLRLDLLVDDLIIVELKCVEKIIPIHEAQILTYLRLLEKPQGLIINFYTNSITKSMKPFVNDIFRSLPDR